MCRNIKTLFNFEPPATDDEIRNASLQFVRKLSGFNKPSRANQLAFDRAIEEIAASAGVLVRSLITSADPRDREVEPCGRARSQRPGSARGSEPRPVDGVVALRAGSTSMTERERGALRARRFRILVRAILGVGLAIAAAIYIAAGAGPSTRAGNDPNDSRQYLRQMQMYGGKSNVVATEIREWLGTLWHGKRLAGTVAFATVLFAASVWFFTVPVKPGPGRAAAPGDDGSDGTLV